MKTNRVKLVEFLLSCHTNLTDNKEIISNLGFSKQYTNELTSSLVKLDLLRKSKDGRLVSFEINKPSLTVYLQELNSKVGKVKPFTNTESIQHQGSNEPDHETLLRSYEDDIISLKKQLKSSQSGISKIDVNEFITWLEEHEKKIFVRARAGGRDHSTLKRYIRLINQFLFDKTQF